MKKSNRFIGILSGIVAAICYGTNPLGALFLYQEGVNTHTVLSHRFSLAAILVAILMLLRKESFRVTRRELGILASLGLLFAASSMTLYSSFHHMDAGIASTLLFVYPLMVALIMAIFFREKLTLSTLLSIGLAFFGIALLNKSGGGTALNPTGIILVMLSSLTYAVYIVIINQTKIKISPFKMNFYVLLFCLGGIILHSLMSVDTHIQTLPSARAWGFATMLAIVPTFMALILLTVSIRNVGSTPAAIMGALEPLTAVLIGVLIFHESFSTRLAFGILLILGGVMLIIVGKDWSIASIRQWLSNKKHQNEC